MPTEEPSHNHICKDIPPFYPACVAQPVSKKEMFEKPKAVEAVNKEWMRLWEKPYVTTTALGSGPKLLVRHSVQARSYTWVDYSASV